MISKWALQLTAVFLCTEAPWAFYMPSVSGRNPLLRVSSSNTPTSSGDDSASTAVPSIVAADDRNSAYVDSLLQNLMTLLDKWILTGSKATKQGAYNILDQIVLHARDSTQVELAKRRIQRAGLPLQEPNEELERKELGRTDEESRRIEAEQRQTWETSRAATNSSAAKSAFSRRTSFEESMVNQISNPGLAPLQQAASDKVQLQNALSQRNVNTTETAPFDFLRQELERAASQRVSELVAQAGTRSAFEGQKLGIGGLDDVLAQVKRRVWIPLAAPPQLLDELGITPVRGMLLYGKPGCGKTLLARQLGQILSQLRPITVVSGPEIMDKFVGSSEMKLREVFDKPPDIYEQFRSLESDHGEALGKAALHVIIMDEFDAIARHRGGRGGSGDQGDAGVARDSVVNQLLAKMDGVAPLVVPTLVIGLTNKRSLIDVALLRPGRFEVQIEVPPPRTAEQRLSILQVHTRHMHQTGRLLVRDAPLGTAAAKLAETDLPSYAELLQSLAEETDGFSGASLAAVARAAASHALERAIDENQLLGAGGSLLRSCVVTVQDFEKAKDDFGNLDETDYATPEVTNETEVVTTADASGDNVNGVNET